MGESVLEFNFETDRLPSEKTAVGTGTLKEKLKKKKEREREKLISGFQQSKPRCPSGPAPNRQ